MDARVAQIKEIIQQYGTRAKPLTAKELADFLGVGEQAFGSALVRLVRTEPHIHRDRPVVAFGKSVYVYWHDDATINPEFKGRVKKRPVVDQVLKPWSVTAQPAQQAAPDPHGPVIVIPTGTGVLSLPLCDARAMYHHLKEVFDGQ